MVKSEIPIRFERADAGHIRQIFNIETDAFALPWSFASIKKDVLENELSLYIVGLVEDKVISYAGFWRVLDEAYIMNIAVVHHYRNKGIGGAMLNELLNIAKNKGVKSISLEVRENNSPAIRMYKNAGFNIKGMRKGYYTDTGENALLMVKSW